MISVTDAPMTCEGCLKMFPKITRILVGERTEVKTLRLCNTCLQKLRDELNLMVSKEDTNEG